MDKKDIYEVVSFGKRFHFIGIGGCGMSAIAKVLLALGYSVSGSDMKESANTMRLKELGAVVYIGHKDINVRDAQIIVYSSAVKADNPEMQEAVANSLPIFGRAQVLGYLMSLYPESVAVAGTHGKTTTSSMISVMLAYAECDPTYLIGGEVTNLKSNGGHGKSSHFVAEADESDGSIIHLNPKIFVLTNIEKDHLDHFKDLDAIIELFEDCVERLSKKPENVLVINPEQWGNKILLEKIKDKTNAKMITFGLGENVDYRAINIRYKGQGSLFTLVYQGNIIGEIEMSVPGEHNILNCLAVIAVGLYQKIDLTKIKLSLKSFTGAKRRFTLMGQSRGVKVYDDYAHHPTEIKATLDAARHVFPKSRLLCAFQPHRYSRTMHFMDGFAESLAIADKVIISSIYGAGEAPIPEVNSETIVNKINSQFPGKAVFVEKKEDIASYLEGELQEGDVFFTVGAGDIYAVGKEILNRLRSRKVKEKINADKVVRIA